MNFFRRLFNNSSDDDSSGAEEASAESMEHADVNQEAQATDTINDAPDPTSTIELPSLDAEEAEEFDIDEDEELPVDFGGTRPLNGDPNDDDDVMVDGVTAKLGDYPDEVGVTRPLPQESSSSATHKGHLIFGQASDTGMVRHNNQDAAQSFFFSSDTDDELPDFGVFIVADGMGGHSEGEKASALTARTVINDIFKSIYLPMLDDHDMGSERLTIAEALVRAIKEANALVRRSVIDGGTTITSVVVLGNQAYFGHVGDSRAYMLTETNGLEQVTRDHSVVQRLIELDQLDPEEAEHHDQRNVLYRAIGQNDEIDVDILRRRLAANATILLCSDGLWGMVSNEDIGTILRESANPQIACDKLVALANTNGGTDNITAVILKMPSN